MATLGQVVTVRQVTDQKGLYGGEPSEAKVVELRVEEGKVVGVVVRPLGGEETVKLVPDKWEWR